MLSSSDNAVLFDDCKSLQHLTVTLKVTQDLVTLGNNGFSFQVNCYPQTKPQAVYQGVPLKWIQYVIAVENNSAQWGIQCWPTVKGKGFDPPGNYSSFGSVSSNQVLKHSLMSIALATDSSGNVTSATFSITDPAGKVSKRKYDFPPDAFFAIYGFQLDLVGPPSGTHACVFTSGAGTLTYAVSPGTLAVQSSNTCGGPQVSTAEESNALYGDVTPASGSTLNQNVRTINLNWSAQVELADRATATGPALALHNGVLCMAWQGIGQNNIWVAVSRDNGATWSAQTELSDRSTVDAPALAVVGGKFAMAWRGLGQDNIWVATSDDGLSWSPQTELSDRSTSAGPGLASNGDLAVMAWRGTGQNNIWVATSSDGIHWSAQVELTDRACQDGPRVASRGKWFAMAWCGLDQNNIWVSTSTDGIHWTAQKELTDRATSASPAINHCDGLGVLYMAWRGVGQANIWVSYSADGENWTQQVELSDRSCNNGPALSPVAKTLCMAWQGSGQNNIWTSTMIET
jgi:hypothetical protein